VGYDQEVYTHFEVGLSILSKEADVGIATMAVSRLLGLGFIPITQERFDMVLSQSTFFEKGVQALMEVLNSQEFRDWSDVWEATSHNQEDPLFQKNSMRILNSVQRNETVQLSGTST
jgi:molybdate-binding protein